MYNLSSKDYRKYIRDIKSKMHCSSNMKLSFISDFNERIKEYIAENSNVTIEKIIEEFGDSDEIANSFNSRNDTKDLEIKAKHYMYLKIIISALIIFVVMMIIFLIIMLLKYGGLITVTNPYLFVLKL